MCTGSAGTEVEFLLPAMLVVDEVETTKERMQLKRHTWKPVWTKLIPIRKIVTPVTIGGNTFLSAL